MAKRPKRPRDPSQLAKLIVDLVTGEKQENRSLHKGRRKGGLKGAKSRALRLTPEQRREIAQTAARARWK